MGSQSIRCLVWFWGKGGAGVRFTHRIAAELASRNGRDNVAMSLHAGNAWSARASEVSASVDLVGGPAGHRQFIGHMAHMLPRQRRLMWHIRDFRADVVVIPINFAEAWPLAIWLRWAKVPLVFILHDANPHPGDYVPWLQRLTQVMLCRTATAIVTLSDYVNERVRFELRAAERRKLRLVPMGKIAVRVRDEPRRLEPGPVRLLFLGRLLKYKGLDLLAAALDRLAHRDDWRLTIAGNGTEGNWVVERFGGFRQVDLSKLDFIDEQQVDALFASHHVVVCPYVEASQSAAVMEGAVFGLPSLVTPVGALPEQIGHGAAGWISQAPTSLAVAEALSAILDHRENYEAKSAGALGTVAGANGETLLADIIAEAAMAASAESQRPDQPGGPPV